MGLKEVPGLRRRYSFPLKNSRPRKISIKLSPQKTYHFKVLHPLKSGGSYPEISGNSLIF